MKTLGYFVVFVISHLALSTARPSSQGTKRKYPPPEVEFKSRDPKINMTIDELISLQRGRNQDTPSKIMDDGGLILTELDLLLTPEQFAAFHPHESDIILNHTAGTRRKRKAQRDTVYRWIQAQIPYTFEANTFNSEEQFMIRESMTEWERYTCMKFLPATPSHPNVLNFINGQYCLSQLGMVGGKQQLELQAPGCRFRGLYIHEIGHAIGLIHEHQRPDRDNYIDIILQNVAPALQPQFIKYALDKVDLVDTTYEYSSVMHYGVTAFSYNGKSKTIRTKDPAREEEIGKVYLKELAFNDVKAVSNMYNCSGNCPSTIRCLEGGYVDENCRCVCPDGSRDCEVGYQKPKSNGECSNTYDDWQCTVWANSGQCHRNRQFMSTSCQKACHLCGPAAVQTDECRDVYSSAKCGIWKKRGDCVANEDWMNRNCRKTCNACVSKDQRPETKCENKHSDSAKCEKWAGEGECVINTVWMLNNCQRACHYCHKTPPVIKTTGDCTDLHFDKEACARWAKTGECEANPTWMLANCKDSCGKCGGGVATDKAPCVDGNSQCAVWADQAECMKNPSWMLKNCRVSCGVCDPDPSYTRPTPDPRPGSTPTPPVPCKNLHPNEGECKVWAGTGHCDINPSWMHDMCRKACGLCSDVTDKPAVCEDTYRDKAACKDWAETGECQANPEWMLVNCKKSCDKCQLEPVTDKTDNKCKNGGGRMGPVSQLVLGIVHIIVTVVIKLM